MIVNPISGGYCKGKIKRAREFLEKEGFGVSLFYTEKKGDAFEISKRLIDSGSRGIHAMIAGGGDGTFNEVANGIAGTGIPMALLPMGTTNVLAKELKIPEDIRALRLLINGDLIETFPGRIKTGNIDRYFLLMVGAGFDAEAVLRVNKGLKKVGGKLAYIMSGLGLFIVYSPHDIDISIDGEEMVCSNLVIARAGCYGGSNGIAPDADLRKPLLYSVIFTGRGRMALLRYVAGVLTKRHINYSDVICREVKKISIKTPVHIQIDGDYLVRDSAEISISEKPLKIFIPQ